MKIKTFIFVIMFLPNFKIAFADWVGAYHYWPLSDILLIQNTQINEVTGYPGVCFVFPGTDIVYADKSGKVKGKISKTKAIAILYNLERRFKELIDAYSFYKRPQEGYKGSDVRESWERDPLPSCLTSALDKLFEEFKINNKHLFVIWTLEFMDWSSEDAWIYDGSGTGSGHNDKQEIVEIAKPIPHLDKAGRIEIFDAYACKYNNNILTSSLLFHEIVHAVKGFYPDCFQEELGFFSKNEEAATEDSTSKVFGGGNTNHVYESRGWNPKGDDAVYKKVCICKPGCPPDYSK